MKKPISSPTTFEESIAEFYKKKPEWFDRYNQGKKQAEYFLELSATKLIPPGYNREYLIFMAGFQFASELKK